MYRDRNTVTTVLAIITTVALLTPHFTAPLPAETADKSIDKDRSQRQIKSKKSVPVTPKWGFFGTIFHLILEVEFGKNKQANDTKSAYNQISDLVNAQFVDDNVVMTDVKQDSNGTTETPKISRKEFLNILDRNLKGLARLRALESREARKDTKANIQQYKEELFGRSRPK